MLEQKILVVVDYQNDFVSGSLSIPDAAEIENAVVKRIEAAYADGDRVIFLKDTHSNTYLKTLEGKNLPVKHCIAKTEGHMLYGKVKDLEGRNGSITIEKAQFGTLDIPNRLKIAQIVPKEFALIGVALDICVISNALILKSQFREVPVKIYKDGCAATSPAAEKATYAVAASCHISVE